MPLSMKLASIIPPVTSMLGFASSSSQNSNFSSSGSPILTGVQLIIIDVGSCCAWQSEPGSEQTKAVIKTMICAMKIFMMVPRFECLRSSDLLLRGHLHTLERATRPPVKLMLLI